jgi:hypothetical protein
MIGIVEKQPAHFGLGIVYFANDARGFGRVCGRSCGSQASLPIALSVGEKNGRTGLTFSVWRRRQKQDDQDPQRRVYAFDRIVHAAHLFASLMRPTHFHGSWNPAAIYRVMLLTCEYMSSAALITLEFDS